MAVKLAQGDKQVKNSEMLKLMKDTHLILTNTEWGRPASFNTQQMGGGIYATQKKNYSSGTRSQIDFKLGYNFKFVYCLETYRRKMIIRIIRGSPQI